MSSNRFAQQVNTSVPLWRDMSDGWPELLAHLNATTTSCLQRLRTELLDDNAQDTKAAWTSVFPTLIELVSCDDITVQRAACVILRSATFGSGNVTNKKSIASTGGLSVVINELSTTNDAEMTVLLTGILWNLSSCQELKRTILDRGLSSLVCDIIVPFADDVTEVGFEAVDPLANIIYANTCGILRSLSSGGQYARQVLRQCESLIESILIVAKSAIITGHYDCNTVEHSVCLLRNLSFACQEVIQPDYLAAKSPQRQPISDDETVGCFCSKKRRQCRQETSRELLQLADNATSSEKGVELLWQPDITSVYIPLLGNCINIVTIEAALGALQNLTACRWQPAIDLRTAVRTNKGLPLIIGLLSSSRVSHDAVTRTAAVCLRNLAIDPKNKELIGKYAVGSLVELLPSESQENIQHYSKETLCAVLATLYDVIKGDIRSTKSLLDAGGVHRLMYIIRSPSTHSQKVILFTSHFLQTIWKCKDLRDEFSKYSWKKANFTGPKNRSKNMKEDPSPPRRRIIFQQCRVASEKNTMTATNHNGISEAAEESVHTSYDNRVECDDLGNNMHQSTAVVPDDHHLPVAATVSSNHVTPLVEQLPVNDLSSLKEPPTELNTLTIVGDRSADRRHQQASHTVDPLPRLHRTGSSNTNHSTTSNPPNNTNGRPLRLVHVDTTFKTHSTDSWV